MKLAFDSSVQEARKSETEGEYFKFDCADTCPYLRMILKLIRSHPSRIQNYEISLFTGAPSVPKNAIFKTWNSK